MILLLPTAQLMEANTSLPEPVLKLPPGSEASSGEEQREGSFFFFPSLSLLETFTVHKMAHSAL